MIEISLALLGLLGEDVAVVSMLPLDFARSGKRETLFGTGVGFKLCHCFVNLNCCYKCPIHGLFLFVGGNHHCHSLALENRHVLRTSVLLQFHGKTQKLFLSLVLEHDGTSAEEDGSFYP